MKIANQSTRAVLENIFSIIIGMVVVILSILFIGQRLFLNTNSDSIAKTENAVLGENTINGKSQQIIIEKGVSEEKPEVIITSGIHSGNVILFDKEARDYLEGTTIPNSPVELTIAGVDFSSKSNPNGFFSFKLDKDIKPFQIGKITTYDANLQIINSFKFILVYHNYLGRIYFISENKKKLFSLDVERTYETIDNFLNSIENDICIATLDETVNSRDYDIERDKNVVLFPNNLSSEDFELNKFVAFRVENKVGSYDLDFCVNQWKSYSETIQWHDELISTIFKSDLPGFENSISSNVQKK